MEGQVPSVPTAHERLDQLGPRALSDSELVTILFGPTGGATTVRESATRLLEARPLHELAWASADEVRAATSLSHARAAALVAAFELGRRTAWSPPKRGERVLDPSRVHELLRHVAYAEREEFWTVLIDVRGRLIKAHRVAEGSLTACPVNSRDVMREAVRCGADGIVFAHSHPSGDPSPSPEDIHLTDRLRAASELVGVRARDHLILAGSSYYSFVEAGRWRR